MKHYNGVNMDYLDKLHEALQTLERLENDKRPFVFLDAHGSPFDEKLLLEATFTKDAKRKQEIVDMYFRGKR